MPLVRPPTAIPLAGQTKDDRHYAVSFQYNWTGDAPIPQNLGGINFTGSIYVVDMSAVKTPANFPPMRSLQFTETYEAEPDNEDGTFIVYVPSSGQVARLSSGGVGDQIAGYVNQITSLSGVIPIISNAPTQIQFGKEINAASATLHGMLTATLFDFKMPPYLNNGYANQL
jgi:hypothetical protein